MTVQECSVCCMRKLPRPLISKQYYSAKCSSVKTRLPQKTRPTVCAGSPHQTRANHNQCKPDTRNLPVSSSPKYTVRLCPPNNCCKTCKRSTTKPPFLLPPHIPSAATPPHSFMYAVVETPHEKRPSYYKLVQCDKHTNTSRRRCTHQQQQQQLL
jgi:hypothetical protein